ncbi:MULTISPECIES: MFS transporter [Pseudonocardia]|uniref:Multidrug resistance protein MdtL n=2 Tax=Pseudonocardia TaxID=1847 RepID=A0A1Y2MTL0_PSEAH|nr:MULTISPECIES: MFS transporter [Pseudonocardia]OSY38481.1 Multidrug resistance protein MdtL [Pseudonocardia autotrophica]TDN77076.1 putative MFS family arabinose efflux permease [Pseudonocardia autotrophica]BBG01082.1 MFS transporter [Pseudonocardia autotrophica]GEC26710.1 MFS transporter [Pseudonocardia saturnea]
MQRFRLSPPVGFAVVGATLLWFLAASSAPSPLYVVYQERFAFTEFTLTTVFAVYVLALIAALLVVGALSDHVGRRPVLLAAIALEIVALVLFLLADGVGWLLAARIVQGIATGAATATLPATVVDLAPAPERAGLVNGVAPLAGLGLGALATGALVEFAPAPTRLVWVLLLGGLLIAAVLIALIPETITRRPGALASLRPRISVPKRIRPGFGPVVPTLLASWSLGGLYLSLGPSVVSGPFGVRNHLVGGLVVAALCLTGAASAYALRRRAPVRVLGPAAALLGIGTLVTLSGVFTGLLPLATAGTLVAGVGFGSAAYATFGTLAALAAPHERGELFAATYTLAYLAFSVPAMLAGVAATAVGLRPTALVYGGVVVVLAVVATVLARRVPAAATGERVPATTRTG